MAHEATKRAKLAAGSPPRLAVTRSEAAAAMGMSVNSFERHVQPELRVIRRGQLRLYPVRELERWLEANADLTLSLRDAAGQ